MAKTNDNNPPRERADLRISDIAQRWFLVEPLLFSMYCTQVLAENGSMEIPLRVGEGRIEYNGEQIDLLDDHELADRLKVEALRIVLKHPYQRQPFRARPEILYMASNMVILDNIGGPKAFCFELLQQSIVEALPKNKTFEEYYGLLDRMFPRKETEADSSSAGLSPQMQEQLQKMKEATSLWAEDSIMSTDVNIAIQTTMAGLAKGWGTLPSYFVECIKASLVPPINVANLLKGFKKTILNNKRQLTRMRPSRRYGFEQMGSKYGYTTRVLAALDVSGSVDSEMLARMLGMVNRIFKQGIESIDVLQFDSELKGKPTPIRRAIHTFTVLGRGGTDFQPVADFYLDHPEYDGLIYITDGNAPDPQIPAKARFSRPVTWIITDDDLIPSIRHGWPQK